MLCFFLPFLIYPFYLKRLKLRVNKIQTMALSNHYLHLLLSINILLLLPSSNSLNRIDKQALLDIRNNLNGLPGSNFFSTWNFSSPSSPCTSFSGILCVLDPLSSTFRVSVLNLGTGFSDSPGLTGTLSTSISTLTFLTELIVYPGKITGPIPNQIGLNCSNLRLISISNNLLSGTIPDSLSLLTQLHTLDLSHNCLTGTIPVSLLPSLTNLKVFVLSSNNLSGTIPNSLSNTSLLHVDFSKNSLTGILPPLPSTLNYISVSKNSLYGPINAAFSSEPLNLSYVDLSMNKFTEKIPTIVFGLPNLYTILLHRNSFSGPLILPETVPRWQVVDLSHNMIGGEVAKELSVAENLLVNSNRLSGHIPKEFGERLRDGSMSTFYGQHNFFSGFQLPDSGWLLPEEVSVCLEYNCMELVEEMKVGCPENGGGVPRPKYQCPSW